MQIRLGQPGPKTVVPINTNEEIKARQTLTESQNKQAIAQNYLPLNWVKGYETLLHQKPKYSVLSRKQSHVNLLVFSMCIQRHAFSY